MEITLYHLDEPTSGLYPDATAKLLNALHTLADKEHTIIAIKHNVNLIYSADHIIDIGTGWGIKV